MNLSVLDFLDSRAYQIGYRKQESFKVSTNQLPGSVENGDITLHSERQLNVNMKD